MSDIGEQQGVLEIFSKAVDQSSFVLRENAKLLFQELYNRLQCKAEEERLIKDIEDLYSKLMQETHR